MTGMAEVYRPHSYQMAAEEHILRNPGAGLLLEMGMGKTIITLSALLRMIDCGIAKRVLVIAPLRVAQTVWQEEAAKWAHTRRLRIVKVLGGAAQRIAALRAPADIHVINRENVVWLMEHYQQEAGRWVFDTVVIDELSGFKSNQAKRWKALRRVRPMIHNLIGLTGTPAPNGLMDLWAQLFLLDRGERLGRTIGGYRERFFSPGKRNQQTVFEWVPKPGAADAIHRLIGDICISMRAEDYLSLPNRMDNVVSVELSPAGRRQYETMERDAVLPLADTTVMAASAATVAGKLLQLANGAVYDEAGAAHVIHRDKLAALMELLEEAGGQHVLVYYAYRHDLAAIRDATAGMGARVLGAGDVAQNVADWNAGRVPILLAHPDSAGHGLNLQAGGAIVIWYGLTWSLEKYQQANARLYRQGQARPVTVHHLVAKGTIDEQVLAVLARKDGSQQALIDAVRARLELYVR